MLSKIYSLLLNRNFILIGAIVLGLAAGGLSSVLKDYNIYILALVMTVSTTSITTNALLSFSKSIKTMMVSIGLSYLVFSTVLLTLSWFLIKDTYLFYGMVIIAASPPGVAVIPFTHILKGSMNYTMIGTLGTYMASVVLAPLIILWFAGVDTISPWFLLLIMIKIIVLPFLLSRLLLHKKTYPLVVKARGRIVDIGFALIIYTAVGLNRSVFFENFKVLGIISLVLVVAMFGLGGLHNYFAAHFKVNKNDAVSQKLLLTIKSSGFTASTSMAIFGKEAAVPSAILAILVLVYLIYLSIRNEINQKN